MDRKEIDDLIKQAYKRKYEWDVEILEVVDCMGGWIGVVSGKKGHEEMCFVYPDTTVRIFDTTPELARFFEMRAQPLERLVARPVSKLPPTQPQTPAPFLAHLTHDNVLSHASDGRF